MTNKKTKGKKTKGGVILSNQNNKMSKKEMSELLDDVVSVATGKSRGSVICIREITLNGKEGMRVTKKNSNINPFELMGYVLDLLAK